MSKKYFVVGGINNLSPEEIAAIEKENNEKGLATHSKEVSQSDMFHMKTNYDIKHVKGRIIIKVDVEQKNFYTFSNGQTIRVERKYDNLDRSYTQQTLGVVIDAEHIPKDALVLFHFNNVHESNMITNHAKLSGEEITAGVKIYSVPESLVFLWKMYGDENWQPTHGFAIVENVFQPYEGRLIGLTPKKLTNTLYVKTGELKGKIVRTLNFCDYNIHFRNENGIDEHIIRCRDINSDREEIIAIDEYLTEKLYEGKLWVGTHPNNAKAIK
jgi:hypothetical protein